MLKKAMHLTYSFYSNALQWKALHYNHMEICYEKMIIKMSQQSGKLSKDMFLL